ncbi:hypothetical protein NHF50_01255 [Flavobacterium sp. NRK F10]|uniref:hypothetical protein n=1 Tax=Flavobacterium sp. NRK F10 TaxID=2954931 RepID=UPI0020916B45|nr:hypothetical protein [Flavobacterium sp. NRK F10]MCO6173664.1 hypothetical protein [Flavobacterium sp. NRK F10]
MKQYNRSNFHKHTFCIFRQITATEETSLNFTYKSKSGSEYCFTEQGVYRRSSHWGRAANCRWILSETTAYKNQNVVCGYANWTDFYTNNETAALFFITLDLTQQKVSYQHKDASNDQERLLRTASETAKRIKEIKNILYQDDWAKYLDIVNVEKARTQLLEELVNTETPLVKLKSKYL